MLRLKTELARESIECHRLCKELQVSLTDSLTHSLTRSRSLSLSRARALCLYIYTESAQPMEGAREGRPLLEGAREGRPLFSLQLPFVRTDF